MKSNPKSNKTLTSGLTFIFEKEKLIIIELSINMEENHHHLYFFIFSSHLRKLNNYPIITHLGFNREQKMIIIIRFNSTYKKYFIMLLNVSFVELGLDGGKGLGIERNSGYENIWDVNGGKIQHDWRSYARILLHLGNVFSWMECVAVSLGFFILLSRMGIIGMGREGCWLNEICMFYFLANIRGNGMVVVISIKVIPFYVLE